VKVHTFRFQLTVIFDVEVAALVIQDGRLTAGGFPCFRDRGSITS
jgi:hypothetical protein